MNYPVLSHSLDKVRYFRNVLYGDDLRVRIIVGAGATGKTSSLHMALDDVELGVHPANQLCILNGEAMPFLPLKAEKIRDGSKAILVYLRWSVDPFVAALEAEYGDQCEVVIFERDPTMACV